MDERSVLVNDFAQKREALQSEVTRHRDVRDRYNGQTKQNSARRDEYNAQVRALIDEANKHKARRDELNRGVHDAKAKRDELNKEAHARAEVVNALRKGHGANPAAVAARLKAEIRHLEYQQQTTVLAPKKEKELIDTIAAKLKELRASEGELQESAESKAAWEAMRAAKAAAEEQHALVTRLASEAQGEHDQMAQLFSQADVIRKQADAAQADFVRSKVEADREHRGYVDAMNAIRDLERVMNALRSQEAGARVPSVAEASGARAEAEEIFDKFRKGEKLSTEDLMALQKAGRL